MHTHDLAAKGKSTASGAASAKHGIIALLGCILLAFCQWLIFVYAPVEQTLGLAQKIFYFHIPLAWWGMASFFIVCISSILYLCTKEHKWDRLAGSAAELGLLFACLALTAGSFWARSSWGTWWIWDARLITTLLMCFTYAAYLLIRNLEAQSEKQKRLAAVIGILAFLNIPLVYISSRLWSFIHPASVSLEPEMRLVMWANVAAFSFFWFGLLRFRYILSLLEEDLDTYSNKLLLQKQNNK